MSACPFPDLRGPRLALAEPLPRADVTTVSLLDLTIQDIQPANGAGLNHQTEVLDFTPKLPRFTLPKATEYARGRMAAVLALIARGGGRVDFSSWEELAGQLDQAGLIQSPHPSNLRFWVEELKKCKILAAGSPGWIVFPPPEDLPKRKLPASRPAPGLRLTSMRTPEELIAAGFSELETLLEGGRA